MTKAHVPAARRDREVPAAAGVQAPSEAPAPQGRRFRWVFDNKILPWLLLVPALVVIFGLVLWPLMEAFWLSFHRAGIAWVRDGLPGAEFIGLQNYVDIFTDARYRRSVILTGVFGIILVIVTMVLGLLVALLLNRPFYGRRFVAIAALIPWAIAGVAAGRIWEWLFHARHGVVNHFLSLIPGVDMVGYPWFNNWVPALTAVGLVVVWQSYPFVAVSLLAGFQSISPEVIDAARVDGAGPWQRLRHITLPILKPLVMVLIIISTIWNFKIFDQMFVMTGGGPGHQTEIIAITTIAEGFGRRQFGLGAALAFTLFVILLLITIVYIRMIREEEGI